MRDANDTAITLCNMENIDPVGVHTGDSVVVARRKRLLIKDIKCFVILHFMCRELKIEGGCNVQFALTSFISIYLIGGKSEGFTFIGSLLSKLLGYPIARVSAKISVGMHLDEIPIANTPASFEPARLCCN